MQCVVQLLREKQKNLMWPCNTCFFRKEWEQKSFFKAKKVTEHEYDRMLFYMCIGETLNQSALVHVASLLFKGVLHEELLLC